jgi:hypothetical protein
MLPWGTIVTLVLRAKLSLGKAWRFFASTLGTSIRSVRKT